MIAEIASLAFEREEETGARRPIIIRFCGTSAGSVHGEELEIIDICTHMLNTKSFPCTLPALVPQTRMIIGLRASDSSSLSNAKDATLATIEVFPQPDPPIRARVIPAKSEWLLS